jgi:radical SAM protein with 4Fe4S-binding SPASM domain
MSRSLNVVLDLTERCNLKCTMCYFSSTDRLKFAPYDVSLSSDGNMPLEAFERLAAEFFPHARRVALGCATEPMMHPRFRDLVRIAGRYRVPDLWFPTNLLALTEANAEAIVESGVNVVGVSIDGTTRETYEKIRIGATWDRLLARLDLLRQTRDRKGSKKPAIRMIFTWMRTNRHEIRSVPAFAQSIGATELDIRYVSLTSGVDNTPELLTAFPADELRADLKAVARDAVGRGLRLAAFPEFEVPADRPASLAGRVARRLWRVRAGLDRWEHVQHGRRERAIGCGYPGHEFVIRPNGAIFPCIYWDEQPIGMLQHDSLGSVADGPRLREIREALQRGEPIGTCARCEVRRDALYRPMRSGRP